MLEHGPLWFLIADGRRARVMLEQRRGAALAEAFSDQIADQDRLEARDRAPRAHDSAGPGRHAMDGGRNLHEEEEVRFLERVASKVDDAASQGAFAHLVVAAPPRALGILRNKLTPAAKTRLRAELDKDLLDETLPGLRTRLQEALR